VFDYSNEFLSEIIKNLLSLKLKDTVQSNINEFNNQLKLLFGKSFDEKNMRDFVNLDNVQLEKKINSKFLDARNERMNILGETEAKEIEKRLFLQCIDLNWKSHIQYLEQLRQVIGLRSYGQRDPLVEYKKEAFDLFENLLNKLKINFVTILINLQIVREPSEEKEPSKPVVIDPKYIGKKMSRNEPCLCGSGKKYKKCCGAL
jgi:preprotein translocase subunit SecA